MITNYTSVMHSLLLATIAIALSQTAALSQPLALSKATTAKTDSTSTGYTPSLATTQILAGKPGLPRRRVGGGSRLY